MALWHIRVLVIYFKLFYHLNKNTDLVCLLFIQLCIEWIPNTPCSYHLPRRFCRRDSDCWWPRSPPASPRNECLCRQEGDWRGPVECWAIRTGTIIEGGRWIVAVTTAVTSFSSTYLEIWTHNRLYAYLWTTVLFIHNFMVVYLGSTV